MPRTGGSKKRKRASGSKSPKKRKKQEPAAPRSQRKKKGQCRCGSTDHKLITHGSCRLNKKNQNRVQAKKRKQGDSGAEDEEGNVVEHPNSQELACPEGSEQKDENVVLITCSWKGHSMMDTCIVIAYLRRTIKIALKKAMRKGYLFHEAILAIILDAIDRYNQITFEGMKLVHFHILRLMEAGKDDEAIALLDGKFFMCCFRAVSRVKPADDKPTPVEDDPSLAASVEAFLGDRGDNPFACREMLCQALAYAIRFIMANVQNNVKVPLVQRIEKWLVLRLGRDLSQEGITAKHVRKLARRIASWLVGDEEEEHAATAEGEEEQPPISRWVEPENAEDILGSARGGGPKGPELTLESMDVIWQAWKTLKEWMGRGKLPLCQTHLDEGWRDYFPLAYKILKDMEDIQAEDAQVVVPAKSRNRAPRRWCWRAVNLILLRKQPDKVKRTAAKELRRSIAEKDSLRFDTPALESLTPKQRAGLEKTKSENTDASGSFQLKQESQQPRGPRWLFHLLPQHGFATRYFPIDTEVLLSLHRLLGDKWHTAAGFATKTKAIAHFRAHKEELWNAVFNLAKLKGVSVPGVDIPGQLKKSKEFDFFMWTDRVGCSFVCRKRKGRAAFVKLTPLNVWMRKGWTVFRAVDPGLHNLVTVITPKLEWGDSGDATTEEDETMMVMPEFGDDYGAELMITGAEWHDKSGHNSARYHHHRLLRKAKREGKDICAWQTSILSGKTSCAATFLEHAKVAVKLFPALYKHYKQERKYRWLTYRKEQKAQHELCMRVKGDPSLPKECVVIAYGAAALFGWAMRGVRPVPVKRFLEHLRRYVTVVLTSEMRTSQVCSKGCGWKQDEKPAENKPAKKKSEEKVVEALIPMHTPHSADEGARNIHSVRFCPRCRTVWHRDVNAARNIARMFWWQRTHAGEKPSWTHRPRRRSSSSKAPGSSSGGAGQPIKSEGFGGEGGEGSHPQRETMQEVVLLGGGQQPFGGLMRMPCDDRVQGHVTF